MLHEVAGRLGEQHLPSVSGAHDAGSAMHVQTHIALVGKHRLTRMHAHTHSDGHPFWPSMGGKSTLGVNRSFEGIRGARKCDKEGISLRIHFVALPAVEALS